MGFPVRTMHEFLSVPTGETLVLGGWVEDVRNLGSIAFVLIRLRDGTVQVAVKKKRDEALFQQLTKLTRESVVRVTGKVVGNKEARQGRELEPTAAEVLAAADAPLPLGVVDKVGAEFNTRLDNRAIDLRKPATRAIFRIRHLLEGALRAELDRRGFTGVQTPKLAGAGAEGGATLFTTDYFGRRAFLSQSPQLYKQVLMGTGLDFVYEIGPAFRAEPSDTVRHVTEFTSFDAEIAWIDGQDDVLRILEDTVVAAISSVRDQGKDLLALLEVKLTVPRLPLPRVTYSEAIEILNGQGKRIRDGEDIDTEGEKIVAGEMVRRGHEMYFLTEYPTDVKPFYVMAKPEDPEYSFSFDLEYKGDEMASGGQREHRYSVLLENMKKRGIDPAGFEFYLAPFRYGMPPHGGWGLGLDRLVQKLLDLPNIREAILFPRDRNRLSP